MAPRLLIPSRFPPYARWHPTRKTAGNVPEAKDPAGLSPAFSLSELLAETTGYRFVVRLFGDVFIHRRVRNVTRPRPVSSRCFH